MWEIYIRVQIVLLFVAKPGFYCLEISNNLTGYFSISNEEEEVFNQYNQLYKEGRFYLHKITAYFCVVPVFFRPNASLHIPYSS